MCYKTKISLKFSTSFNSTSLHFCCHFFLLPFFHFPAAPQPCWLLSPLSWPSGPLALILGSGFWQPHPLSYRLASTQCPRSSFTNTMHSPAVHLPFSVTLSPHPFCPFLIFLSLSFIRIVHLISSSSLQVYLSLLLLCSFWQLGGDWWADNRNRLLPYSGAGQHERDEPGLTKPLQSETKVVCSIIQTGATPTAASATLTLTNGQKNRWFVHSWPV